MPELILYKRDDCPFCQKVFHALESHRMQVPMRDIVRDARAADSLVAVGGRRQVPCLVIDGEPMYESDAIVAYLDTQAKSTRS